MQADHYENFLEPELAKYNYAGLYKCKTREFMGQYGKMDGCAMFYRRDKFSILPGGAHDVEFNSIARMHAAPPPHITTAAPQPTVTPPTVPLAA